MPHHSLVGYLVGRLRRMGSPPAAPRPSDAAAFVVLRMRHAAQRELVPLRVARQHGRGRAAARVVLAGYGGHEPTSLGRLALLGVCCTRSGRCYDSERRLRFEADVGVPGGSRRSAARVGGDTTPDASLFARHFPCPHFVWVRREDVTAQAVSWARAIQTGRWHHWDARVPHAAPVYDREQIDALAREAAAHDAAWRAWFAANRIDPFLVRFEDLVSDPVGMTGSVLGFLGTAADNVRITELTVRTGDRLNDEWVARQRARPPAV